MEMVRCLKIRNSLGLHARSAAKIVELADRYESDLFLEKDGRQADGSNILSILTLACPKGTEMEVRIIGEDSEQFMMALEELFQGKFGENK
ncbi:MAG: HPr family phosphocarrier protein [Deltaproteobacteria bacterium]|nr:HPr family phosphocarrier protein [Deltaproteobacteria bacterium]